MLTQPPAISQASLLHCSETYYRNLQWGSIVRRKIRTPRYHSRVQTGFAKQKPFPWQMQSCIKQVQRSHLMGILPPMAAVMSAISLRGGGDLAAWRYSSRLQIVRINCRVLLSPPLSFRLSLYLLRMRRAGYLKQFSFLPSLGRVSAN